MAANPRLDDLRKRLEKDPGSRLFAQLAEELRKEGDLDEAITVCREGLQKNPAYPSARMTLGRALFDKGDLTAARPEFEVVLKGAPDNILASRLLAECLDGLGDLAGAVERYNATLVLAPGDKQILTRLQDVEGRLGGGGGPGQTAPAPGPTSRPTPTANDATLVMAAPLIPPAPVVAPEPPPIPLAAVMEESFELERPYDQPGVVIPSPASAVPSPSVASASPIPHVASAPLPADPPPIPVVAVEEEFELERPHEAPLQSWVPASPPALAPPPASSGMGMEFAFDEQGAAQPVAEPEAPSPSRVLKSFAPEFGLPAAPPPEEPESPDVVAPEPAEFVDAEPEVEAEPEVVDDMVAVATAAPAAAAGAGSSRNAGGELVSPTLAELYFNQGFTDKAIEVYRQLLEREPGNDRAQARMKELRALDDHLQRAARSPDSHPPPPAASPEQVRRRAVERTIARLEALLAAARKQ